MTDPITSTVVLSLIADKFIEALFQVGTEKAVEKTWTILKGDRTKNAFKLALVAAREAYTNIRSEGGLAKITRWIIALPLFSENSFLTQEIVVNELTHILRFDRKPNYQLIGERWKAAIEKPLLKSRIDFTSEAESFVECLRIEMRSSEIFGPILDSESLDAINANVSIARSSLINIEAELVRLTELMNARFGDLIRVWAMSNPSIQEQIRDFTWLIQEKTDNFVGRRFVFDKIEQFMKVSPRGYLLIKGDPGIGKTSLIAEWVKGHGSIHHFNIRAEHINNKDVFLKNVCAQIIAAYKLDYDLLPLETTEDSGFLIKLLNEASKKLKPEEQIVVVVDALDEVDHVGSANLLYLPKTLPQGVYVIATSRRDSLNLRVDCELEEWSIEQDSDENQKDIREFIERWAEREGIQAYIRSQEIDKELFVDFMTNEKSQGNFMYLRYVLPEIENGAYTNLALARLPSGLERYYEDHWGRMRTESKSDWLEFKLPIIVALSIVKQPVPIERIADFSHVQDYRRIYSILQEWRQFLYEQKVEHNGKLQKRYRVYHDSFREFLASQEAVNLVAAHVSIANKMWEELYGKD